MRSVEWLAGVLEGEGCFSETLSGSSGLYTTPLISLVMTDYDIVEEVGKLFFSVGGRQNKIRKRPLPSGKTAYTLFVTGLPAAKIMNVVLPHMGERRSLKIKDILRAWSPKKYKEAVAFRAGLMEGEYGAQ